MEYSKEELLEAQRQLASTVHKLKEVVKTLEAKPTLSVIDPNSPWPAAGSPPSLWRRSWWRSD